MNVLICMLRGVNLAANKRMKMEDLRAMCASMKLADAKTFIQSGNVLFRCKLGDPEKLAHRIEAEVEKKFGFHSDVILRTVDEMRVAVKKNPFAKREFEPAKLAVTFLSADPGAGIRRQLATIDTAPEEMVVLGREIYTYFPNGMARPKIPWPKIEKILNTSGTARNWNTVRKMLAMAEEMED